MKNNTNFEIFKKWQLAKYFECHGKKKTSIVLACFGVQTF